MLHILCIILKYRVCDVNKINTKIDVKICSIIGYSIPKKEYFDNRTVIDDLIKIGKIKAVTYWIFFLRHFWHEKHITLL